eukprot:m.357435 g.357435  ORF g.357435 m.357435 type:complete len:92 (-) comp17824_c0_seq1:164-439(-)
MFAIQNAQRALTEMFYANNYGCIFLFVSPDLDVMLTLYLPLHVLAAKQSNVFVGRYTNRMEVHWLPRPKRTSNSFSFSFARSCICTRCSSC